MQDAKIDIKQIKSQRQGAYVCAYANLPVDNE